MANKYVDLIGAHFSTFYEKKIVKMFFIIETH